MKRTSKSIIVFFLITVLTFSFSFVASAVVYEMVVGDTRVLGSSDTKPFVSSNTSVIEIQRDEDNNYTAVAVGKGTARISGGDWSSSYIIKVSSGEAPLIDFELINESDAFGNIIGFIVLSLIFGIVFIVFSSVIKVKKLNAAIYNIDANPCQSTADAAIKEFTNINLLVKIIILSRKGRLGCRFGIWRDVFNRTVVLSQNIDTKTKVALKQALLKMNTEGLYDVKQVLSTEESQVEKEKFGVGGEDNVWYNLKVLSDCDIYRNVKIHNSETSSEIDAVIVNPERGIFLVEIKSLGGIRAADGHKYISYNELGEDPSNQIIRHEKDFISLFADINLKNKIKNILVFSWPHGEERRLIDKNTFPQMPCDIITIEQLLSHLQFQPSFASINESERDKIATKLKNHSGECVIR